MQGRKNFPEIPVDNIVSPFAVRTKPIRRKSTATTAEGLEAARELALIAPWPEPFPWAA
jgi:hypothetical protein